MLSWPEISWICASVLGTLATVDEDFAAIKVDVADLDVHQLADAHGCIEEEFEEDFVLHVTAGLNGPKKALQFGVSQQLR